MHKVVFAAGFNKPKTFSVIEPLHRTFNFISHDNSLIDEIFIVSASPIKSTVVYWRLECSRNKLDTIGLSRTDSVI